MSFPENMTFQYFFFDTYPGFFLQVLPIALIAGIVYGLIRFGKDKQTPIGTKVMASLFVCYMAGLFSLVVAKDVIADAWYRLIYHMDTGNSFRLFMWDFNLVPDFWRHLDSQTIGNLLMFLPFGILFPFFKKNATLGSTLLAGVICTLVIECFQPAFGRAFDINDIIMNALGVLISSMIFFAIKKMAKALKHNK